METPNCNHLQIYSSNDLLIDAVDSVSILHQLGVEENMGILTLVEGTSWDISNPVNNEMFIISTDAGFLNHQQYH